jgi:mannose-6-phosphate isomerase
LNIIEIQQTSDVTYRIFDWNRVDAEGNSRELHTALAVDAIDFESGVAECVRPYEAKRNEEVEIVKCDHFTTSMLEVEGVAELSYVERDSFTIYICLEGEVSLDMEGEQERLSAGEVVLIPASANEVVLSGKAKLLTTYI